MHKSIGNVQLKLKIINMVVPLFSLVAAVSRNWRRREGGTVMY